MILIHPKLNLQEATLIDLLSKKYSHEKLSTQLC